MIVKPVENNTQTTLNDEERWQAVAGRAGAYDGEFVYAVRSTGVYCKPSCPSRRPSRQHVSFFSNPDQAEAAGYRACRRCRPNGPEIAEETSGLISRACRVIEGSIETPTLEELGDELGVSPYHLHRTFKRVMGITPRQYAAAHRSERLKSGLRNGESVTGALYDAGYGSSSRMYEQAPSVLGMTPSLYKKGGEGMKIRYTVVDSSLGKVLVGATERGVCAVSLGSSETELQSGLRREYPRATMSRDDGELEAWAQSILRHIEGREPKVDLPLDIQATAFQQRVWEELRRIPYGSTRSYSDVARRIGRPGASRAVAQACGSNHVALLVPCHRVVRENGEPGGYRWGVPLKLALLSREHAAAHAEAGE